MMKALLINGGLPNILSVVNTENIRNERNLYFEKFKHGLNILHFPPLVLIHQGDLFVNVKKTKIPLYSNTNGSVSKSQRRKFSTTPLDLIK